MEVEKTQRNVLVVRFDDVKLGWEKWILLTSDRHHDSRHSNLSLAKEHMEQAKERDAHVIDCGDFFDAMQGKYDPRRSYKDMQPKYIETMLESGMGYLDLIAKDAADFYAPYADRFLLIAKGNHETAIESHNDINLTQRLVTMLNSNGGNIQTGYYGGYVRFQFVIQKTVRESKNLKYFHGSGMSSAPVTRGVIQTNRQAVIYPDADIIVNGHNHENYVVAVPRERLSDQGKTSRDIQWHVRTPGYKDGWNDGGDGFDVERGTPKSNGAVWLRFFYHVRHVEVEATSSVY